MPEPEDESALAKELIESGSDLVGAVSGAAIGLIGGSAGAIGGATAGVAISRVLRKVGAELRRRILGPREEVRIGAALAVAATAIKRGLDEGRELRNDGFFEAQDDNRAQAEELLEGVLLKARDAYEEKKVQFLGQLYANLAFHPEISPAHANHLIALAGQLTYRQLVTLAIAIDQASRHRLRQTDFRGDAAALAALSLDGGALLTEIYDLYQRGLINDTTGEAWISLPDVRPGSIRAQGSGSVLSQLMNLNAIPAVDREPIYTTFPSQ